MCLLSKPSKSQHNKFWEAIFGRILIYLPNHKLDHIRNQVDYHPFEFQLERCSNESEIIFRMNLGLLPQFGIIFIIHLQLQE